MIRRGQDVRRRPTWSVAWAVALFLLAGCRQDMHDQPRYEAFEESDFFSDGQASRLQIEGTVARGQLQEDSLFYLGLDTNGQLVRTLPIELDAAALARGRELFDIYCSPCHDRTGSGNGMIVQRGFKRPESFHSARLRRSAPGYFVQVMTNGFGEMSAYAAMVGPRERWAVTAYIRALQLSQAVPADQLAEVDRAALAATGVGETADAAEEKH